MGDIMSINKIMSKKIITTDVNSTIYEVSLKMKQNNIGFLPITKGKQIVGVITDRDIVISSLANKADFNTTVDKYMCDNIITIDDDFDEDEALEVMAKEKIKRLLVLNKKEEVVGVLSISDILNSEVSDKNLLKAIKSIWNIETNQKEENTEVDTFYL